MNLQKKSLISVHLAVLLFGISGLFAKMINLSGIIITFGRVLFSSIFLFFVLKIRRENIRLECGKKYVEMFVAGIILAVHWTTFMFSIQMSTVAIGTITFSTFPLFVTFLEPYVFHEKLKISNICSAVIMMVGVFCIVPEFELGNRMTQGILLGMICSFSYAILSLWNRKFASDYSGSIISFYEQGFATIVLLPSLFIIKPQVTMMDMGGLLLYGILCTAMAHSLFIEGLKYIRVQTAGIISSLESVYGIIAAALVLREIPGKKEIIGGIIILGVVFFTTIKQDTGER
ncbi:DMT family transporter [Faecalimonas sp.]